MSANEAKGKFEAAKKAVEDCRSSISELQRKSDILEESLPSLNQAIGNAEKAKTAALDSYALHGEKQSESELKRSRTAYEQAIKQQAETNELFEATTRALKKQESEFIALQAQKDSLRHQLWLSIFEQRAAEIPESVRATVIELVVIGLNCSMGLNFILPRIFLLPTNTEIQQICKRLSTDLGIE